MMWCPCCGVRFDYSLERTVENQRSKQFIQYLKKILSCEHGAWMRIVVNKIGNTYQIHWPIKKGMENDEKFVTAFKSMAKELSTNVFDMQPVNINLSDEFSNTVRVVTQ